VSDNYDWDKHLGMTDGWREKGCAHYLDWFYTVWTGKDKPEKQQEFYDMLRQTGFMDGGIIDCK
jgi:hypothetical protein